MIVAYICHLLCYLAEQYSHKQHDQPANTGDVSHIMTAIIAAREAVREKAAENVYANLFLPYPDMVL